MNRITPDNYEAFLLDYMEGRLDADAVQELKAFALAHPELEIDLEDMDLPVLDEEVLEFDLKSSLKKTEAPQSQDELLFEFMEGQLDKAKQQTIEARLLEDKLLAKELELLKKTILKADTSEKYPVKAELYKTEEQLVTANQALAYFEQQLSGREKQAFESELTSNAALRNEVAGYASTRLVADKSEVYPDKTGLKKEGRVIVLFSLRSIAAMAAALLLLAGLFVLFGSPFGSHQPVPQQMADNHAAKQPGTVAVSPAPTAGADSTPAKKLLNTSIPAASGEKASFSTSVNLPAQKSTPAPQLAQGVFSATTASQDQPAPDPLLAQQVKQKDSIALPVPRQPADTEVMAKQTLLAVAEDTGDEEVRGNAGFFKKAARLAKRAHQLGIKAVDGNEGHQRLSLFNSFSVEKH